MSRKALNRLGAVFSLGVFCLALGLLYNALKDIPLADVLARLREISPRAVALSVLFTAGSYLALGGFDWLAIRYMRRKVALGRVLLGSFIAHGVSHSTGFAALTGGTIRYRLYSGAGLSAMEVAGIIVFAGLTFFLGAGFLISLGLLFEAGPLSRGLRLPEPMLQGVGVLLAALIVLYAGLGVLRRRPFRLLGRKIEIPPPRMVFAQLTVAVADLALVAAAFYVLLPPDPGISYPGFVSLYVLANVAGVLMHVPGGIGIFETIILIVVPGVPTDALVGAMLVFRAIYFLLPLGLAGLLLACFEALHRAALIRRSSAVTRALVRQLAPQLSAAIAFVGGGGLLFASATRQGDRLGIPGVADLTLGLAGIALVAVSRALNRRSRPAADQAAVLMAVGAGAAVWALPQPFVGLALAAGTLVLITSRVYLSRGIPPWELGLTPPWLAATAMVLAGMTWVALLTHLPTTDWSDALGEGLPASLAPEAALLIIGISFMIVLGRRSALAFHPATPAEEGEARRLAEHCGPATSHLFLEGNPLLFAPGGAAALAYRRVGEFAACLGDPIGPPALRGELAWRFAERCESTGLLPLFWRVTDRHLFAEMGFTLLRLGEEASIDVGAVPVAAARAPLRVSPGQGVAGEFTVADAEDRLVASLWRGGDEAVVVPRRAGAEAALLDAIARWAVERGVRRLVLGAHYREAPGPDSPDALWQALETLARLEAPLLLAPAPALSPGLRWRPLLAAVPVQAFKRLRVPSL